MYVCHAGLHEPREASLVTLEQAIAPRVMPPGPLMRMVRGMCARTVSHMMADLQSEIRRRRVASKGPAGDGSQAGGSSGGSSGGGKAVQQRVAPPAACMSASALDLFACAAPLQLTIEL